MIPEVIMNTDLLTYCQNMSMSYSYKPVLILALLNGHGHVTLDEAVDFFRRYYSRRLELGLIAERSNSIFSLLNCTMEEMRQNIRANPVKALLNTSNLFSFDGYTMSIKTPLTADDIVAISSACHERLTRYYTALKPSNIICFSKPDGTFGFMSNDYPSVFSLHGEDFSTVSNYLEFRKVQIIGNNLSPDLGGSLWEGQRQLIAYQAIMAKFTQNRRIKADLLDTGTSVIAACLQQDTVWGNGLAIDDSNTEDINRWHGLNLLGFTLMHVRNVLWCG